MASVLTSGTARWRYGGGRPARFHLWLPRCGPLAIELTVAASEPAVAGLAVRVFGPDTGGVLPVADGRLNGDVTSAWRWTTDGAATGVWDVEVGPPQPEAPALPCALDLRFEGAGIPFLLPEPGIVPSHFLPPGPAWSIRTGPSGPSSRAPPQGDFTAAEPVTLYLDVPSGLSRLTLRFAQVDPERTTMAAPSGEAVPLAWRLSARQAQQLAELEAPPAGWWRLDVAPRGPTWRVAVWDGLPLFWARPEVGHRFPYARVLPRVTDGEGRPVDARCTLARGGRDFLVADVLAGEQVPLPAPPGRCRCTASRGLEYAPGSIALDLPATQRAPSTGGGEDGDAGPVHYFTVRLRRRLPAAQGWLSGDCHLHSYHEDAPQPPAAVARAARAAGLDYAVLTDYGPETAEADGFTAHSVPGGFLALPGQEAMTPELHAGALNVAQAVPCPPFGSTPPSWPAPEEIVAAVRQQASPKRPVALVLNHPHADVPRGVEGQASALRAYFRSWWVIDRCPEIAAVENFDWAAWVRRLNGGRRLAPLWTTDTHDVLLLQPGARRTYVWTGGHRDAGAILDALVAGRSFHTGAPGALLWLTVQGAPPGAIVSPAADGTVSAHVSCTAAVPLARVDLIVNGTVNASLPANGELTCSGAATLPLPPYSGGSGASRWWALAAAYACEPHAPALGHASPLDRCGFVAFTSPVYVGNWPEEVPRAWR